MVTKLRDVQVLQEKDVILSDELEVLDFLVGIAVQVELQLWGVNVEGVL